MNICNARGPHSRRAFSHNWAACPLVVLLAVCCLSSASAQWSMTSPSAACPRPRFRAEQVRRQVRANRPHSRFSDPSVSSTADGEFLLDTDTSRVPAPGDQNLPAIAFDGTNYFVVWQDDRNGVQGREIYGARVTPASVVLDPTGIAISNEEFPQQTPAVAFCGGEFLVVWEDGYYNIIRGARVTTAGVVLDPASIVITSSFAFNPVVTSDSNNFLVVWGDARNVLDNNIYGARVTPGGTVLDHAGIAISRASGSQQYPAVAYGGSNFLVVWQDNRGGKDNDIYAARVSPSGVLLDSTGIAVMVGEGYQQEPGVAFGGGNYLVAWQDDESGVHGARVTPAGEVLDRPGFAISTSGFGYYPKTAVAFDDTDFFVAWTDERSGDAIYGARVTTSGVVLDTAGIPVSTVDGGRAYPAAAFDGDNLLVVWTDGRGDWYSNIYGTRVTPEGTVLDSAGVPVSTGVYDQSAPSVAFDGTSYLAVWEDGRTGGPFDIYGTRVTSSGTVLDSSAIPISTAEGLQWQPAIGFDGQAFLVVWVDSRNGGGNDLYGARVTTAGVVLDTAAIPISTATDDQWRPAIAFDGANFLVVWYDESSGDDDILGARVTPAGAVLDTAGFAISSARESQHCPAVAFDGQNFLVVWDDGRINTHDDIFGARVTPSGVVLDTAGIAISTADGEQRFASIVFDGENFVVAWETYYAGGVYAARVSSAGVVLDTMGITLSSTGRVPDMYPTVAFGGANSLVVWQDTGGGSGIDLFGARIRPDGTVFDKGRVVTQQGDQTLPALVRGSGSQLFLVYQGWAGVVGGRTYNTNRIWGDMNPNPGIEESPGPQATSHKLEPTIIRGVFDLQPAIYNLQSEIVLLSVDGRKVLDLHPGANDVRALASGVYFVTQQGSWGQGFEDPRVTKVVVTK